MKQITMLMMAVLTILSLSGYARQTPKQKEKTPQQITDTIKYSCPMHADVTSSKPGKCSVCGMAFTKSNKGEVQMKNMKMYCCPMHPGENFDKPGKCSKCGMELKNTGKKLTKNYKCTMHPDVVSTKPGVCSTCGMALEKK